MAKTKPVTYLTPDASRKRTGRIVLVVVALLLVVGIVAGAYGWRAYHRTQHIAGLKAQGMDQLKDQKYAAAAGALQGYLGRFPTDVEALRAFADASEHVFDRNGQHLKQAMGARRRVLELDPGDEQTRRDLMEQYLKVGFHTEAIGLADTLLDHDAEDAQALRAKAKGLSATRKYDPALEASLHYNRLKPDDAEMQMLTIGIMQAQGARAEDTVDRIKALADAHPDDGRYQMALGYAYQVTGQQDRALAAYRRAASSMPVDPEAIGRLAGLMDRAGLYNEVTKLLQSARESLDDPGLERLYVRRLFEQDQTAALVQRANALDPDDPRTDSETLGILGLTQIRTGHPSRAKPMIDQLNSRPGDELAVCWSAILEAMADPDTKPERLANLTASALTHFPNHPLFHFYQAQALSAQGKTEAAINDWQAAAQQAPSWTTPLIRIANGFLDTGRSALAVQVARAAVQRAPNSPLATITLLRSLGPRVDALSKEQIAQVTQWADSISNSMPAAGRASLAPLRIGLQARAGNLDHAKAMLREAISAKPAPAPQILMQLASVSSDHNLGLTRACLDTYQQAWGMDPRLAYTRAMLQAPDQNVDAILADYDQAAASASSPPSPQEVDEDVTDTSSPAAARWALYRARIVSRLAPDRALSAWRQIVEDYPRSKVVLLSASSADQPWTDPKLAARLVEQIRQASGEQSTDWKLARARQLMHADKAGQREFAEASALLVEVVRSSPYSVRPKLMLAECFEQLDNLPRALQALNEAQSLSPESVRIALDRLRLQQKTDDADGAQRMIQTLANHRDMSTAQRIQLARLMSRQGDFDQAMGVLREALKASPDNRMARLMLANLLWRQGQIQPARAELDELLANPDEPTLRLAIALHEDRGEIDAARALMDRMDQAGMAPDDQTLYRAAFALRRGKPDRARELVRGLTDDGDAPAEAWRLLMAIQLQTGDTAEAIAAASKASKAYPDRGVFSVFADNAQVIQATADQPLLQPLVASMFQEAAYRPVTLRVLRLLVDARDAKRPTDEVTVELSQIADQSPRFAQLQTLVIQLDQVIGRQQDAAAVAERTMRALPGSAPAAWQAAQTMMNVGRWDQAVAAGQAFQDRADEQTLASDLLIAKAQLNLGQAKAASERLEPYLQQDTLSKDQARQVKNAQALALIQLGRVDQARALLQPGLATSAADRAAFMQIASSSLPSPQATERWLTDAAEAIPDDQPSETVALARAWGASGQRWRRPEHLSRAVAILRDQLRIADRTSDSTLAASAYEMLGMLQENMGHPDLALEAYRSALTADPDRAISQNNLAVLLLDRGQPEQALTLASGAAKQAPDTPAFQDTLAQALLANDQPDQAVTAARRALQLQPGQVQWYLALGETLVQADQSKEARALIRRLDSLLRDRPPLDEPLRSRLQALRTSMGQQAAAEPASNATPAAMTMSKP